jgi:hypothetical protein
MMARYGGEATLLVNSSPDNYDPATGTYTPTTSNFSVKALLMDYTMQKNGASEMGNTLILVGDKQCYIQPRNKANPNLTMPSLLPNRDRIKIGTDIWKIVSLKDLNPSGTNSVLIELHLRK